MEITHEQKKGISSKISTSFLTVTSQQINKQLVMPVSTTFRAPAPYFFSLRQKQSIHCSALQLRYCSHDTPMLISQALQLLIQFFKKKTLTMSDRQIASEPQASTKELSFKGNQSQGHEQCHGCRMNTRITVLHLQLQIIISHLAHQNIEKMSYWYGILQELQYLSRNRRQRILV